MDLRMSVLAFDLKADNDTPRLLLSTSITKAPLASFPLAGINYTIMSTLYTTCYTLTIIIIVRIIVRSKEESPEGALTSFDASSLSATLRFFFTRITGQSSCSATGAAMGGGMDIVVAASFMTLSSRAFANAASSCSSASLRSLSRASLSSSLCFRKAQSSSSRPSGKFRFAWTALSSLSRVSWLRRSQLIV